MRTDPKITNVYAESLLELAADRKQPEEVEQELKEAAEFFQSDASIWAFFKSPVVMPEDKLKVLNDKRVREAFSDLLYNFLGVLAARRRFDHLPAIVGQYGKLLDELLGRRHVYVYVVRELEKQERDELLQSLQSYLSKKIVLETQVRPDLLGGVLIRSEDLVLDTSIKRRLQRLKHNMLQRKIAGEDYYEN